MNGSYGLLFSSLHLFSTRYPSAPTLLGTCASSPSDLASPEASKLQPLEEGCELAEGDSIGSLPLSPCPFHRLGAQRLPLLG